MCKYTICACPLCPNSHIPQVRPVQCASGNLQKNSFPLGKKQLCGQYRVKRARGCVWGGGVGAGMLRAWDTALLLSVVTRLDREVLSWAGVTGSRA